MGRRTSSTVPKGLTIPPGYRFVQSGIRKNMVLGPVVTYGGNILYCPDCWITVDQIRTYIKRHQEEQQKKLH